MKGDLSKEMVSDKGEINMEHIYVQSNLISEYTWGPSKLLLVVLANHID